MKRAIILFTRVPVPGKTKTRMMPYYSGKQCAALHRCFLQDIASAMQEAQGDLFICYSGRTKEEGAEAWFERNLGGKFLNPSGNMHKSGFGFWRGKRKQVRELHYYPQEGNDLGERMYNSITYVLKQGYEACVLVGSDIPELTAGHLEEAWRILEKEDVVLGSSKDGGYYLVGMKRPRPELFQDKLYSHDQVLREAIDAAEEAGLTWGLTGILSDVDTPEDLRRLRNLRGKTKAFIERNRKVSVIVPIYNEEARIGELQKQLKPYLGKCEILFVDGGSSDRTVSLIEPVYEVLHSPKGRANQMNYGAAHSHGDILFFLHCDSQLPEGWLGEIRRIMKQHQAGCFGVAFDSRNFFMWTCRIMSNLRAHYGKIMFGDQGIFMERSLFFELGGYPDLPIMEDYQLSMDLKKRGIDLGMARRPIVTSSRRFPDGTWPKLRVMWQMHVLRWQYRHGVPVEEIARAYKDIR